MRLKIFAAIAMAALLLVSCAEKTPFSLSEGPLPTSMLEMGGLPIQVSYSYGGEVTALAFGDDTGRGDVLVQYLGWNGSRADYMMYSSIYWERYRESGETPPTVPEGAELIVSFGDYAPSSVILSRDTATFDRAEPNGGYIEPITEELGYSVTRDNGTSIVFAVEYNGGTVMYYTLRCEWKNGNQVLIAVAVRN